MLLFLSFWITDIFQKYEPVTRDFLKKKIITDKKTFLAIKQNIEKEDSINLIFYLINKIKIISGYFLKYFLIRYFLALYIIPDSYAQPLTSFRPFDWTLYKASGTINSFTEPILSYISAINKELKDLIFMEIILITQFQQPKVLRIIKLMQFTLIK